MAAILFVHGAGLGGASWRYQTDHFTGSIAPDLPGHGDSDGPTLESISEYADWLGDEVRRTGSEPITLIGHSMGSLIALETAARNQDMVARLVLMATSARMKVNPELLAAAQERDAAAAAMVIKWSLPKPGDYGRSKKWVLAISDGFMTSTANGVMADDLIACDSYAEALTTAGKIRCPVLLILGEHDRMTPPPAAQPLAAAIDDARIIIVEKTGHMLQMDKPGQVNETIGLFLGVD